MTTVGEALVALLEARGVDTVFGIPGVHTVELYRGLAASRIRHITPRHEQGAAFMADGYSRVSGRPGVVFAITGPGVTNTITAMAQARADSVPMLVISGVNAIPTLGRGLGCLHELPDQRGLMAQVALEATRVAQPSDLQPAVDRAFARFAASRPGPVHIEIPLDVMALPAAGIARVEPVSPPGPDHDAAGAAARLLASAVRPLILAGGGAKRAEAPLKALAEQLDAPVVTTANARGLLHAHPLLVPASPSLAAVRTLVGEADVVLAVGTEFGPTDYDMYVDGGWQMPARLVRVDVDAEQLDRHAATVTIEADASTGLETLLALISPGGLASGTSNGASRAARCRDAARAAIGAEMQAQLAFVEAIRDAVPGCILVGDSTQPVYAANLYYDHDRPGGWFNAATGYGALGFGPPAAIGAALAAPGTAVVCLSGDGGFQFTMAEIAAAVQFGAAVAFVVWNNRGYREIEVSMREAGVEPVGVSPAPPDFSQVAGAYGIRYAAVRTAEALASALAAWNAHGVVLLEIAVD